jgi:hypothetical protein
VFIQALSQGEFATALDFAGSSAAGTGVRHKKAFGFSWISLSESSLFEDLRRPLGAEFL